jgi:hypothetical protein
MNTYAAYYVLWGGVDPWGLWGISIGSGGISVSAGGVTLSAGLGGVGVGVNTSALQTATNAANTASTVASVGADTAVSAVGNAASNTVDAVSDAVGQYGEDFVDGAHGVVGHHYLDDVNASTDQTGEIMDAAADGYVQGGYGVGSAFTGGFFDGDYGYLGWDKEVREWLEDEGYGNETCPDAYGTGQNAGRVIITIWTLRGASSALKIQMNAFSRGNVFKIISKTLQMGFRVDPAHHGKRWGHMHFWRWVVVLTASEAIADDTIEDGCPCSNEQ